MKGLNSTPDYLWGLCFTLSMILLLASLITLPLQGLASLIPLPRAASELGFMRWLFGFLSLLCWLGSRFFARLRDQQSY